MFSIRDDISNVIIQMEKNDIYFVVDFNEIYRYRFDEKINDQSFKWLLGTRDMTLTESMMTVLTIGIDTKIEVIVVSPTTWEAHHSPRAKPEGCGELPKSLVTPQWPKSRYQFRFYHDAPKHIKFMQIRVCISRKSLIKLLQISHHGKHGHRPLSQQLP